jgi:putative addiction module component (TIGR02574 family)
MAFTAEQIRQEALRLPPKDRARLAGELIHSLDEVPEADRLAVDTAWRAEVERRVRDMREGRVEMLDGDKVMQELRSRLKK